MRGKDKAQVPLMGAEYRGNSYKDHSSDSDEDTNWSDQDFVHLVASSYSERAKMKPKQFCCLLLVFLGVGSVFLLIGVAIGRFALPHGTGSRDGVFLSGVSKKIITEADPAIGDQIVAEIKAGNIREHLKKLTEEPHIAGSEEDYVQAKELESFWKSNGMDSVFLSPYELLLSYPNKTHPNKISIYSHQSSKPIFTSQLKEKVLRPEEDKENVIPPFNAYSPSGTVMGQLLYVNYGHNDDFTWLAKQGIIFSGKICLARYGKLFRGDKEEAARKFGCSALLLYSDPANYAPVDVDVDVYPKTWWLPGTGVQRGTLYIDTGDPETPGYPSIDSAYRIPREEINFPVLPVHAIGYDDATQLLSNLTGDDAPPEWRGGLPITYRIGPGFIHRQWYVKMEVNTYNIRKKAHVVTGIIRGEVEPDRYVIIGNHRDAWVFGGADPSSGTAAMLEISRAFTALLKKGWRPRRSIMFCSWGAEEYGILDSAEWVEQYYKILSERAVAYLNVDIAVQGDFSLRGQSTPLMIKSFYNAAKATPNPQDKEIKAGRQTVYDTWLYRFPEKNEGHTTPQIRLLGSGSDYAPFLNFVGVTCLDLRYTYDEITYKHLSDYPLYHSMYETFYLMDQLVDPGFKLHRAVGQVWAHIAWQLADEIILPMDTSNYAVKLSEFTNTFNTSFNQLLKRQGIMLDKLYNAVAEFTDACKKFDHHIQNEVNKNDPNAVRKVNDQILQLERAFTDPFGLPARPATRHVLFARSNTDSYTGTTFPGLVDALFEIEDDPEPKTRWRLVKKQLSVVTYIIRQAASTLKDVVNFKY